MTGSSEPRPPHVCPVWIGYLLASPVRSLFQNPRRILGPHVTPGMRVLDVGPGMGFFTLPLARRVGPHGRVVCVDVQEKMLLALMRRARRAGVAERVETRVCDGGSPRLDDLGGTIDFVLAFAVVHEVGDSARLFAEIRHVLKRRGRALVAEPKGHVSETAFRETVRIAQAAGLTPVESPKIRGSHAVLLERA